MTAASLVFLIQLLGFVGFLWLGLYVLTRGERDRISRLTAISSLAVCCLFLTGDTASTIHPVNPELQSSFLRIMWWTSVMPAALWLHLSLRLIPRAEEPSWYRPVIYSAYALGAIFTLLGTTTNLVNRFVDNGNTSPTGPLFHPYQVYLLVCAGFAVVSLDQMRALPRRTVGGTSSAAPVTDGTEVPGSARRLLIFGAICFLAAVVLNVALTIAHQATPTHIGLVWILLLIGLAAVGGTVVVQSNLLLGRDVRSDFLHNLAGLSIQLAPFLIAAGALLDLGNGRVRILVMLTAGLTTLGHTLYDLLREWLDTAFFSAPVRQERAAARAYVQALASTPAGPSPELATRKAFDDAVRRAVASLSDPTKLVTNPLLNLTAIAQSVTDQRLEDNRLNRAAVLKDMLLAMLDGLRPLDAAGGATSDSRRFYNCLYYPYVHGITRRRAPTVLRQLRERRERDGGPRSELEQVTYWLLQLDEATFYKWQRRGSDTIAGVLREREAACGGAVPADIPLGLGPEAQAALVAGRP